MISQIALMGMASFLKKKIEWTAGTTTLKMPKPFATKKIRMLNKEFRIQKLKLLNL
jgi:hypothetical protein